ncbi:MAG: sialidase family protein, partial [Candidatus Thermoplasmatota archaeon]
MRNKILSVSMIVFCIFFATIVPTTTRATQIEEDPLVPGWSEDIRISNASGDSIHPSIAVDSKGCIHVVWQDSRTGDWKIYYARSRDKGEHWEEKVVADLQGSDNTPSIIVDQNNVIHMVWSGATLEEPYTEVYYKNSTDEGNTWSKDVRLTYAPDDSHVPKIVAYGNTLHVVWSDKRSGDFEIYYKRSDGGNNWTADVRLTNAVGMSQVPTVSVASPSQVVVTWTDQRDGNREIYYKKSVDSGETWTNDTRLTYTKNESRESSVVIDSYNNIHIVWYEGEFGRYKIYYRKWVMANEPRENATEIVSSRCACMPFLQIDSNDNLHLLWS